MKFFQENCKLFSHLDCTGGVGATICAWGVPHPPIAVDRSVCASFTSRHLGMALTRWLLIWA